MKYMSNDYKFDSKECVDEMIEVIKSHEVPFIILDKMLEEVRNKLLQVSLSRNSDSYLKFSGFSKKDKPA